MALMGRFPNRVHREYVSEVPVYRYLLPCGHKVTYHWRVERGSYLYCRSPQHDEVQVFRFTRKITEVLPRKLVAQSEAKAAAAASEVTEPKRRPRTYLSLSDVQISEMIDNAYRRNRAAALVEGTDMSRWTWERCQMVSELLNEDALDAVKGLRAHFGRKGRPHESLAPEPITPTLVKNLVVEAPGMPKNADTRQPTSLDAETPAKRPAARKRTGCHGAKRCTGRVFTGGLCRKHFRAYLEKHNKEWNPEWDSERK